MRPYTQVKIGSIQLNQAGMADGHQITLLRGRSYISLVDLVRYDAVTALRVLPFSELHQLVTTMRERAGTAPRIGVDSDSVVAYLAATSAAILTSPFDVHASRVLVSEFLLSSLRNAGEIYSPNNRLPPQLCDLTDDEADLRGACDNTDLWKAIDLDMARRDGLIYAAGQHLRFTFDDAPVPEGETSWTFNMLSGKRGSPPVSEEN